ncbi:MAG: endonuclease/exonuclease/phosphatase family protein [Bacilli bacterium]|nr:endonuclease/exonuclease/phosphatase family protein [Bacilli bacterium]
MKILTLNTHSLSEENGEEKRKETARLIVEHKPDIIALQEVNQTIERETIKRDALFKGEIFLDKELKQDNYASALISDIKALGLDYQWVWIPVKVGYDKFDEGLAILSLHPIITTENILLTNTNDFSYWKKRNALGVELKIDDQPVWLYTVHMGWWDDDEEPFIDQWRRLNSHIQTKEGKVYLAGDFNAPDDIENQSYAEVLKNDWFDTYKLASETYGRYTAKGQIDGWKDGKKSGMRIDYIFVNQKIDVKKHEVIFDGHNGGIVSDHYGLIMEEK